MAHTISSRADKLVLKNERQDMSRNNFQTQFIDLTFDGSTAITTAVDLSSYYSGVPIMAVFCDIGSTPYDTGVLKLYIDSDDGKLYLKGTTGTPTNVQAVRIMVISYPNAY